MSVSQFGQDLFVLHNIYKGKRNGYYVEVGSSEGTWGSNSLMLEKDYGWSGICVECNPYYFNKLRESRNCHICTNAVYNEDGLELDFYQANIGGHSGLVDTISNDKVKEYSTVIKVKTKKLATILEEFGAPTFIEFLSLDTEGSEFKILEAHDFDKYMFGYICVEHNNNEDIRKSIRTLLESKGYTFYRKNEVDDDYILSSMM
jgi:FkbM family methyltransferase